MKKATLLLLIVLFQSNAFAKAELTGSQYLSICGDGNQFNTCLISFFTMKAGFDYGFNSYPVFILNKKTFKNSEQLYCQDAAAKWKRKDIYNDFLGMLKNLDKTDKESLNQDIALIMLQYLSARFPVDKCI